MQDLLQAVDGTQLGAAASEQEIQEVEALVSELTRADIELTRADKLQGELDKLCVFYHSLPQSLNTARGCCWCLAFLGARFHDTCPGQHAAPMYGQEL